MAKSRLARQHQTEMRRQLELSFNRQFAENQNHHQNVLFKLLTVLAAVILGYGYVLHGYQPDLGLCCDQPSGEYDVREAIFAFVIAQALLMIGLTTISNIAYAFRRDQLVNFKIRDKHGLIARSKEENNIFPFSYNPMHDFVTLHNGVVVVRDLWLVNWMPGFHKLFSITFLVFQVICIAALMIKSSSDVLFDGRAWLFSVPILFLLGSLWILLTFRAKLRDYYLEQGRLLLMPRLNP